MEHIVREFDLENTHISICDDYCRQVTSEDAERTLTGIIEKSIGYFQLKTA